MGMGHSALFKFQSTPPSREATVARERETDGSADFNPRLPRGRRPGHRVESDGLRRQFQSTPPSREATGCVVESVGVLEDFNPRLPRGRRRRAAARRRPPRHFNPRLPRGRRRTSWSTRLCGAHFNPRLPRGRRLKQSLEKLAPVSISIHASLAGGDVGQTRGNQKFAYFNPRLPRGRRRSPGARDGRQRGFQSTPPSREATPANNDRADRRDISIHASLAGGDRPERRRAGHGHHFNPRLPRGRRRDGVENAAPD